MPTFWKRLGGGSLSISLLVHGVLILIALVWTFRVIPAAKEPRVDFLPQGGGGGQPGQQSEVAIKRRAAAMHMPSMARLAARNTVSDFTLPEPDAAPAIPSMEAFESVAFSGGGGGGGAGGGRGGGFGPHQGSGLGSGKGAGLGAGLKPFAGIMFGNPVEARTIGVVLDVSGSMTPHLPKVIAELDRMAPGSPLVLYVGCGIGEGRPEDKTYSTGDRDSHRFERFWRLNHNGKYLTVAQGSAKAKVDFSTPLPAESLFRILAARKNTFYIDYEGSQFAWTALLAKEMKEVEAVYWFADFQDRVDEEEAGSVMKKLRGRKQKLYLHASGPGGNWEKVRDLMVTPTGGKVIEKK